MFKRVLFISTCLLALVLPAKAADAPAAVTGIASDAATAGVTNTAVADVTPTGQVRGRIMELGTSDPVEGAIAGIIYTTITAESDSKGNYILKSIAAGKVYIDFKADGYADKSRLVEVEPGQDIVLNIYLERVDFTSDAIVVNAKKEEPETISSSISSDEIKKVPGTAGDALRAMQSMPGIAALSDFSSRISVQGGGPDDNLYLLDNIPWPFPFHFGGILSTINTDILSSVDLNEAGFDTRWGDCMGAVLDAHTRPGNKTRLSGEADISMLDSQLLLEGPLGLGDASFTIAGRRSYLDIFLSRMSFDGIVLIPYFWDLSGTVDFSLGPANHFHVMALGDDDRLLLKIPQSITDTAGLTGSFNMDNGAFTTGINWVNTSIQGIVSTLTPYFYQTGIHDNFSDGSMGINTLTNVYGIKEELSWKAGELLCLQHEIVVGGQAQVINESAILDFFENYSQSTGFSDFEGTTINTNGLDRAVFLEDRIKIGNSIIFTPGARYDKNDQVGRDTVTPRLQIQWQYDESTICRAAWGYYSQFPEGFELNKEFGDPGLEPEVAEHFAASVEKKLSSQITGRVDAYYKTYTDLILESHGSITISKNGYSANTATYNNNGFGIARGVEFFLQADYGERFFGWISYALSKSDRLDPFTGVWSLYQYDQTNILSLVASYKFTPAWGIGAKLHYNTGPLFESLLGKYQDSSGNWHGIFSSTYNERLADYMRLDLRTDYTFKFEGWNLYVYLEIINFFNSPNPQSIGYNDDYTETRTIDNLPRIPYIGMGAEF